MNISNALKITGWMKPKELEWLAEQASSCELILEVGSYHGRSTTAMLDNSDAHIVCVDLWGTKAVTEDDCKIFYKNIKQYMERLSVIRGRSHEVLDWLIGEEVRFDMVFIDGGHPYENVYGDVERGLKLTGGLICGHDFNPRWAGVVQAVKELIPDYKRIKGTSLWWI